MAIRCSPRRSEGGKSLPSETADGRHGGAVGRFQFRFTRKRAPYRRTCPSSASTASSQLASNRQLRARFAVRTWMPNTLATNEAAQEPGRSQSTTPQPDATNRMPENRSRHAGSCVPSQKPDHGPQVMAHAERKHVSCGPACSASRQLPSRRRLARRRGSMRNEIKSRRIVTSPVCSSRRSEPRTCRPPTPPTKP